MQAGTVGTLIDAMQSCPHIPEQIGLSVQIPDCEFALGRVLDFVQSVRALLNRDAITVTEYLRQFSLFCFQDFFKLV
jgi:hypothetical protein